MRVIGVQILALALLGGCAASTPSPAPQPSPRPTPSPTVAANQSAEDVFRELIAAINVGDADAAAQLLAEDATIYGRNVAGIGMDAAIADFVCAGEITAVESSQGDSAVVELEFTGPAPLAARPDCPIGPAGRHSITIRDGQIVLLEEAGP